jgi:ATP-binding cassette subfamily F protein 3
MKEIVPAHIDSPFKFDFSSPGPLPAHLMQIEDLAIGFQEPLVKKMNLGISSESRIGLLGFNGSGKSTFLKVLAGQLSKLSGEIIRSKKLRVGYYAQHQVDVLNIDATPIELIDQACEVREVKTRITEQQMKNFLGGFDFHGERVNETIKNFSGGEKARLALAIIVWSKPNLLLMDEPTNHLDIEMCHALEMALQAYEGAMIIVSHDRHLLANTINEFYSINNGVFAEYVGSIADYESWVRKSNEGLGGTTYSATKSKIIKQDRKAMRQSSAAKRQKLAPLRSKEKSLEKIIKKIGKELEKIEEELLNKNLYIAERKAYLSELLQTQGRLKSELVEIETEWLEIQEKLEPY